MNVILNINIFTTGRVNYELNSGEQQKHNNGNNLKVNKVKLLSILKTLYIEILNKYSSLPQNGYAINIVRRYKDKVTTFSPLTTSNAKVTLARSYHGICTNFG